MESLLDETITALFILLSEPILIHATSKFLLVLVIMMIQTGHTHSFKKKKFATHTHLSIKIYSHFKCLIKPWTKY